MKTVHRFELSITDLQFVEMPRGAQITDVIVKNMYQRDPNPKIDVYAIVDPDAPKALREFRIYGTGHAMDESTEENKIGVVQVAMGAMVFHVFDRGERMEIQDDPNTTV